MRVATHVAALLGTILAVGTADGVQVDATGRWSITGSDEAGTQWAADMYVGQGVERDGKYPLTGSIYWQASGGAFASPVSAWEDFEDGVYETQAYFDPATMIVHIEGYQVRDDTSDGHILPAVTEATVTDDGVRMINGTGTGSGVASGHWQGQRVGDVVALTMTDGVASADSIVFTLKLSAAGDQPVSLDYETYDDTALVNRDYTYTHGTLTIPPGDTSQTITVPLLQGATIGTQFFMRLYSITNAIAATRQAVGTITISPADSSGVNGSGGGMCGQGVGAGNLIAFYAVCWLGLAAARWRRQGSSGGSGQW